MYTSKPIHSKGRLESGLQILQPQVYLSAVSHDYDAMVCIIPLVEQGISALKAFTQIVIIGHNFLSQ